MMLTILLALAAQSIEPDADEIYADIFHDLFLNAMIGNGNREATLTWVSGHDQGHPPELRIRDLRCYALAGRRNCRFDVTRTPDPQSGEPAGDAGEARRLRCRAAFVQRDGPGGRRWRVVHFPPGPGGGHSRTSMDCRVRRAR